MVLLRGSGVPGGVLLLQRQAKAYDLANEAEVVGELRDDVACSHRLGVAFEILVQSREVARDDVTSVVLGERLDEGVVSDHFFTALGRAERVLRDI